MPITNIVKLTAKNVGCIKDLIVEPGGRRFILFTGKNGQGKTTAIEAVYQAMGGKPKDKMPIRKGEREASITLDLGDIIVERTFTLRKGVQAAPDGAYGPKDWDSELTVRPSGASEFGKPRPYESPQENVLDRLLARGADDPWKLDSLAPKEQFGILSSALGLDFEGLDTSRTELEDERRTVKAHQNSLTAKLADLPDYPDVPDVEQSASELSARLQTALRHNNEIESAASGLDRLESENERIREYRAATAKEIESLEQQIASLRERIAGFDAQIQTGEAAATKGRKELADRSPIDTDGLEIEIADIESTNRKIRSNQAKAEGREAWKKWEARRVEIEKALDGLKDEKKKRISEGVRGANFSLPWELDYDEIAGEIFVGGIPLSERSHSERLRVYIALYLAQNPRFRFVPLFDLGVFDEDNLAELPRIAEEQNCIIWGELATKDSSRGHITMRDGLGFEVSENS